MRLSVLANTVSRLPSSSINVACDETLENLVDYLLASERAGTPWFERLGVLTERFALSFDDARLAVHSVRAHGHDAAPPPGRAADPLSWIAYRRSLGEGAVQDGGVSEAWRQLVGEATVGDASSGRALVDTMAFQQGARNDEKAAAAFWRDAYDGAGRFQSSRRVRTALHLHDLGRATMASSCSMATKTRVVLQVATAIGTAAQAEVKKLAGQPWAREGSRTWADAVRLADVSREVAHFFGELGQTELERRAHHLRRRIVNRIVGQCPARVAGVLLNSARCALRHGESADVAILCERIVADLERVVEEWESTGAAPYDEHRIALEHLRSAIDILGSVKCVSAAVLTLRLRCDALLAEPGDHLEARAADKP